MADKKKKSSIFTDVAQLAGLNENARQSTSTARNIPQFPYAESFGCHSNGNSGDPKNIGYHGDGKIWAPRYHCDECGRSYSTSSGLSKHKQFHCLTQNKRQYSCKYCEKTYSSMGALKMHIRTHTLPCKCCVCGKAFSRPWLLQGHVRTHTGEKPFRCSECGRAFADRSNLRAHLQTHSEVKKYKCHRCQRSFSRMSLLSKHESNGVCSSTS